MKNATCPDRFARPRCLRLRQIRADKWCAAATAGRTFVTRAVSAARAVVGCCSSSCYYYQPKNMRLLVHVFGSNESRYYNVVVHAPVPHMFARITSKTQYSNGYCVKLVSGRVWKRRLSVRSNLILRSMFYTCSRNSGEGVRIVVTEKQFWKRFSIKLWDLFNNDIQAYAPWRRMKVYNIIMYL